MLRQLALRTRQLGVTSCPTSFPGLRHTARLRAVCSMADGEQKARQTPRRRRRSAKSVDVPPEQTNGMDCEDTRAEAVLAKCKEASKPSRSNRTKKAKTEHAEVGTLADVDVGESLPMSEPPGPADASAEASAEGDQPADSQPEAKPKKKRQPKVKWPPGPLYDSSMRPPKYEGPGHRFISWNVAGMRALIKKDAEAIKNVIQLEHLDALCLQEHKLQANHVEDVVKAAGLENWHVTFNCSTAKKGYSGTATLCREKPLSARLGIGIEEHDDEGRVVTVELPDLWLVNVYVPNSGDGLKRLDYRTQKWDIALSDYIMGLQAQGKPVVITGDMNCAHQELDIHDPKSNLRSAGFTQEERDSFGSNLLGRAGLIDTWRAQHPGIVGYTYYGYRHNMRDKGKGWRLDYFLVSSDLANKVHDSYILKEIRGSDHAPLGLVIKKGTSNESR